jgi:L-alanine-DL-glutamate epimerase-like enolase superfamily enzyme
MSEPLLLRPGGARVRGVFYPYHRSIRWSDNVPEHGGTYAMLTLETTSGLVGVGEATIKPIWSGSSMRSVTAAVEDVLLPRLAGVDLADAAAVAMALAPVPENMPGKTLIDNACWDLRAQMLGEPLWQALGGQRDIALSWTLTRAAVDVMVEEAQAVVAEYGFQTIKIKGGQGIATDAAAVRGIRRALGDGVTLYVDANWQYPREQGVEFAQAIIGEGAVLVEDPWSLQADAFFHDAVKQLPVPILVDYFCSGSRDVPVWLDRGAQAFSIKPGRIGISDGLAMARLCAARGARVVVGTFAETDVGSLHTLSFASAQQGAGSGVGSAFAAESSFFLMFETSPLKSPLRIEGGRIRLPAEPGIAPLIDWTIVDRHTLR